MNNNPPLEWLLEVPPVSRMYLILSTIVAAACAFDLLSPLSLYFNVRLIARGQFWRLITTFLYFGSPGLDFCLHMFFLVRYSKMLEEGREFHHKTSDFLWLIIFGMLVICLIAPFLRITFFGSSLTFMMVYVWARRNEEVRLHFLGLFPFRAPYLPWVLLSFSALLGSNVLNSVIVDGLGIVAGHLYFYAEDVYPKVAQVRGWTVHRPLRAPIVVKWLFGETDLLGQELMPEVNRAAPGDFNQDFANDQVMMM